MRPKNTAAAIAARRQQSEQKVAAVEKAIGQLRRERSRLTIRAIAERAGVSATFLYENTDARALVKNAVADSRSCHDRLGQTEHERIEATWRERALNPEAELTRTQKEIFTQRQRIGELMGQIRDFGQMVPGESVQALITENTTLQTPRPATRRGTPHPPGTTRRRPLEPPLRRQTHRRPRSRTSRTGPFMTLQRGQHRAAEPNETRRPATVTVVAFSRWIDRNATLPRLRGGIFSLRGTMIGWA
ncbi:DUF6262 family protein [Streptomyces abikoensis]|uniref:DUF6262 family protein n=1 Tax=Streptomyces abikoensis TaxID=97398 RepID=A0ABW7T8E7_9ACTN